MSAAVEVLEAELTKQTDVLDGLQKDWKQTIEDGQRAQREVDSQTHLCAEIKAAIGALKAAERARQVEV
jgi:hypothetical protein